MKFCIVEVAGYLEISHPQCSLMLSVCEPLERFSNVICICSIIRWLDFKQRVQKELEIIENE